MNYKITSDSTCDLSCEQAERYSIGILPLYVQLGDRTYQDGVDIFPDDIYQHITAGGALATTAAVNLSDYVRAFSALSRKYDFVIHICISQEFSCCYQNACLAAAEYENVYVVDSRNLSTGHGLVVLEAVRCAEEGMEPVAHCRAFARMHRPCGRQLYFKPPRLHAKGRQMLICCGAGRKSFKAPPGNRGQRRQDGRLQKIPRHV